MSSSREPLAIDGGRPVRDAWLPYARQSVDEADVAAVVSTLRSDWLTTGPVVEAFELAFARRVGASSGVATSSGTAALHAVMHALKLSAGDEVVTPAMTFAASANCVVYAGATPVFADVDADTLLVDPKSVRERITPRTRAILAVDYAGQPCDYTALRGLASEFGLRIVADGCHALGATLNGQPVGMLADVTAFSFHPVKHITSGEGGMATSDDEALVERMRIFRNHGITTDHRQRERLGRWEYDMVELGYNYRLSDLHCALAMSQLTKLDQWLARRREIASRYDTAFADNRVVRPLARRREVEHAYHLYVVRFELEALRVARDQVFAALRAENIGVNVHYRPVHSHTYYRHNHGTARGDCPVAELAGERILSLPIHPAMCDADVDDVVRAVEKVVAHYAK